MPFNVSEEQSLLSSMLTERDAQISTLTHQLHSTSELLHSSQRELQSKSASRKAQREEHSATIKKLKEEHAEQRRVLAKFEQSVKGGGGLRVHEYAALMRSANSSQVESTYVVRLQAQLCRAMHSLGVMESQLALVKENCSSLIKFMKEDLSHMVDDRTRREIELMNGLARVDNEKRVMAEEMEQKIQEKEELLDQVREEYEELGLEYDENEVKRALEVKYLLEQMEKVKDDKVRLEKELLAALLEREEQINKLKVDTQSLGEKLDGLKKEAHKRSSIRADDEASEEEDADDNDDHNEEAEEEEGDDDQDPHDVSGEEGEERGEEEDSSGDEVVEEGEEDAQEVATEQEDLSGVTSQLEDATIDEPPSASDVADDTPDVAESDSGNIGKESGEAPASEAEAKENDGTEITAMQESEDAADDDVGGEKNEKDGDEDEATSLKDEAEENDGAQESQVGEKDAEPDNDEGGGPEQVQVEPTINGEGNNGSDDVMTDSEPEASTDEKGEADGTTSEVVEENKETQDSSPDDSVGDSAVDAAAGEEEGAGIANVDDQSSDPTEGDEKSDA